MAPGDRAGRTEAQRLSRNAKSKAERSARLDQDLDPSVSLATFGVGYVARPIGSFIMGHLGDRFGRKPVLIGTLLLMGLSTFLVGCLPTYDQIGILAPILLVFLRICQGTALGGEYGGAAIYVAGMRLITVAARRRDGSSPRRRSGFSRHC